MNKFYLILANNLIASVTTYTVWFAIIFYTYLETGSVFATSIISGIFLIATASTGIIFGGIVDHNTKKNAMLYSSIATLISFTASLVMYLFVDHATFKDVNRPELWIFIVLIMIGVIAGNIRGIALPTLVTIMIPEDKRPNANGLVGTVSGVGFLLTSVFSGLLVGHSGMYWVLILAVILTGLAIVHLVLTNIPEDKIAAHEHSELTHGHTAEDNSKKLDLKGTVAVVAAIPGLFALIFFTTFNNFLGGVFMSLMDAYGLELVSVEVWGIIWGVLSCAFIIGGLLIAKYGVGKKPVRTLFLANVIIWTICIFFTIPESIWSLSVGMFVYLLVGPFIEASEHTIMQKLVPLERQGRVFGFAQSVEQAASPFTAFLIGPLAQFVVIPFMSEGGKGAELIGSWFGVGEGRGISLVFTVAGILGLITTLLAMSSKYYKQLSHSYAESKNPEPNQEVIAAVG